MLLLGVWLTMWALFLASLAGMALAALLWTTSVRQAIVSTWVATQSNAEEPDLLAKTGALFEEWTNRLLMGSSGRPSRLKVLATASISTGLALVGFALSENGPGYTKPWFLLFVPCVLPFHWYFEYAFVSGFMKKYEIHKTSSLVVAATRSLLGGIGRLAAAWLKVFVGVLLCATVLAIYSSAFGKDAVPWWLYALVSAPLMANGIWLPLIIFVALRNGQHFDAHAVPFFCLSFCLSMSTLALLLVSIQIMLSRRILGATAAVCEYLDRLAPPAVFAASSTLFALATGLMQAYGSRIP